MRPENLREAARKKAGHGAAGRLVDDGHGGSERAACVGAVYDAEPVVRRPHDIIPVAEAGKTKHKRKTKPRALISSAEFETYWACHLDREHQRNH